MEILLETRNLTIEYKSINEDNKSSLVAVKDVSLKINRGEIYALAGESGCGKSTLAKAITKLIIPKSGDILFMGKSVLSQTQCDKKLYPQQVQMVFQNPYSSLNPRMKIKDILQEPLDINTKYTNNEKKCIVMNVLKDVGLKDSVLELYPHEFSGGQRQRIAIARALILDPKLLIADEPVSALDASIQAQIINLLKELRQKRDLTILFISHDMNVIHRICDRVFVMYQGEIVENGDTAQVFENPQHEYTKKLLSARL